MKDQFIDQLDLSEDLKEEVSAKYEKWEKHFLKDMYRKTSKTNETSRTSGLEYSFNEFANDVEVFLRGASERINEKKIHRGLKEDSSEFKKLFKR